MPTSNYRTDFIKDYLINKLEMAETREWETTIAYLEREVDMGEEVETVVVKKGEQRVEHRLGAPHRNPPN